jgi:hypothetical protein
MEGSSSMINVSRHAHAIRTGLGALVLLLTAGCGGDGPTEDPGDITPPAIAYFVFKMHGDTTGEQDFIATTRDPAVIALARAQLQLPEAQRLLHVNGPIAAASPPQNIGWHWRFVDSEWTLTEASLALCDGTPNMVEQALQNWLQFGSFCPWGSYVAAEQYGPVDVVGVIVKFTLDLEGDALDQHLDAVDEAAARRGIDLDYVREGALATHVWRFEQTISRTRAEQLALAISAQVPDVQYAEPNFVVHLIPGG